MRKCVFRKRGLEADYVSEYDPEQFVEDDNLVIVIFNDNDNFKELIHIDDGDMVCMMLQKRNDIPQTITR